MTSPLDNGDRWAMLGVTAFLMGCGALVLDQAPALALINESSSLPRGLYVRLPGRDPDRAAIVALPQPASARSYLSDLGLPGDLPLLKRVAAVEGEVVCRRGVLVTTPRTRVRALTHDRRGRPLPAWNGCRRLEAGEIFVLGDTATSFDSRYFGVVRRDAIEGVFGEGVRW